MQRTTDFTLGLKPQFKIKDSQPNIGGNHLNPNSSILHRPMSGRCVLAIGGSDSGAGAGIQADLRTIQALGGYALTAITAVTAQNTQGVAYWEKLSPKLIREQIDAVAGDFAIRAIKTGLLAGGLALQETVRAIKKIKAPWVIDPVLASSSGTRFLNANDLVRLKKELFPGASLITPNWPEASLICGITIGSFADVEIAARRILDLGAEAVLIKGGHGPGRLCRDYLLNGSGTSHWYEGSRLKSRNTHGTGCVLASAIATGLAHGEDLSVAVEKARAFLRTALLRGTKQKFGRGVGPAFAG